MLQQDVTVPMYKEFANIIKKYRTDIIIVETTQSEVFIFLLQEAILLTAWGSYSSDSLGPSSFPNLLH